MEFKPSNTMQVHQVSFAEGWIGAWDDAPQKIIKFRRDSIIAMQELERVQGRVSLKVWLSGVSEPLDVWVDLSLWDYQER